MITKWDLVESFSADYPSRWKVVLHGERDDGIKLSNVLTKLSYGCGRPSSLREKDFNWAFYIYQLEEEEKEKPVILLGKENDGLGPHFFCSFTISKRSS